MSKRKFLILALLFFLGIPSWGQKDVCIYCKGDTLLQKLNYVDGPKFVCQNCIKKYPKCSICHLTTNLPQYRDQRYFCPSCQKIGIFSDAAAAGLQAQVVAFLQTQLGSASLPPIRMCDDDELQTKFREHGRSMNVGGFYCPYNPEMVYLLTGEPAVELQGTMAHEYTHAWQSRNCQQQDRALTEGFANLMGYHWLVSRGETARAEALKGSRDPDYGASLVKLLAREQTMGMKNLVAWVKTARTIDDK